MDPLHWVHGSWSLVLHGVAVSRSRTLGCGAELAEREVTTDSTQSFQVAHGHGVEG